MNFRGRPAALLAALLWMALGAGTADAQDGTWQGPGNQWTTGANWSSTPTVPTGVATFTNNGAPTSVAISGTASINTLNFTAAAPAYSFAIGNGATFTITGGTTNASASFPSFSVATGATLALGDGVVADLGSLSGGGAVVLGPADPTTLLAVNGPNATTFSGSFAGAGSFELDNGAAITLTGASNGGNIGTIGGDLSLCNCDTGGLTISGGSLTVLGGGFGSVQVLGGTLSVVNGGTLQVGSLATPAALLVAASMNISGPGSSVTVIGGPTGVGIFAQQASLVISNGGVLNSRGGAEIDALPIDPGVQPSVTVTGPGSTWNIRGVSGLSVGGGSTGGAGSLSVLNGGTVNVNQVTIGDGFTGTSSVLVSGAGSVLNVFNGLTLGGPGCGCGGNLVGTLTVADGALVNTPASMGIFTGSTLQLGTGGLAGALVSPSIVNEGQIIANFTDTLNLGSNISGGGTLAKLGSGTLILSGNSTYTGGTTIGGGTLQIGNGGTTGSIVGSVVDNGTLAFNLSNALSFAGVISGSGALQQLGSGTTTLTANNTYTGGTLVNAGMLQLGAGASLAATGALTVNGGVFNLNGNNQTVGALAGTGGAIALGSGTLTAGDASNTTLAAAISGTGGFIKQGSGAITLTGASGYTGATLVNAGTLVVNGSLASAVTVNGGRLQGTGTVGGLVVSGGGTVAPGNSIGTLTVNGSFVQASGTTYQVEVNAAGQSDRINVGGAATINGGTVQVLAQSGTYARNTTYTILNATGGVSGTYASVTSNFAFLTPTLAYDANNVFLNLFQPSSAFAAGAQTPNQYAVGTVLDQVNATATGDLNTVLNALSVLSNTQGPAALNAISGQQYADFGTLNVQGGMLFMNAVGQQMALARGSAAVGGQRQALAQACEIESCDAVGAHGAPGPPRWADWAASPATAIHRLSPTISAAPRPASTIASTRASWWASARATARPRNGSTASWAAAGRTA